MWTLLRTRAQRSFSASIPWQVSRIQWIMASSELNLRTEALSFTHSQKKKYIGIKSGEWVSQSMAPRCPNHQLKNYLSSMLAKCVCIVRWHPIQLKWEDALLLLSQSVYGCPHSTRRVFKGRRQIVRIFEGIRFICDMFVSSIKCVLCVFWFSFIYTYFCSHIYFMYVSWE